MGFRKLLKAIDENVNLIREIGLSENQLSDHGAVHLVHWLKNMRMKDVEHSLNLCIIDISLNKVLYKTQKDVEI